MPAYNEERTIVEAVTSILSVDYPCDIELIVVDDGSTDATTKLLRRIKDERVVVIRHPENRGKGAALRSALSIATGTHVVPFDADLEYLPEDILNMLQPVLKGRCHVVYGVRLFGCNTVYQSYRYAVGNRLLTRAANVLYDASLSDLHTCLKLMPLPLIRAFKLTQNGFGMDTEVTALLLRCGIRPFEVPVSYYSRSREQGKKITWRDAVACLRILLHVRIRGYPRAGPLLGRQHDHYHTATSLTAGHAPEREQDTAAIFLKGAVDDFAPTELPVEALCEAASHGSRRAAASQAAEYTTVDEATA
jgi:dolichol-phosphate hexosyltransferase